MEVKMDPRLKTSVDDLQKQFDLMLKLRDRQEEMNRSILAIRDLRVQLNLVEKRWDSKDNAKAVIEQSKDATQENWRRRRRTDPGELQGQRRRTQLSNQNE